ncbi:uncharacterized protein LOC106163301 [Lingula anatina]|uniref:Uncharacterized protein LOC106163300 n=1 Tax=Lingula anatina TaxID=7574 RepID=A0A1S3IFR0_LINAN|nr:uncharacterized protein LOC106163300 [Lingula anatina]XP_013396304.1 uncharacterized protein LOC106163301 [Lingula anatina]|eukprot:XP_013396303.1 uncharacterized protein LOC106163300 [Lingula anatina]
MAQIFGIDHKMFAIGSLAITSSVAVYSTYKLISERRQRKKTVASENVYETQKLLNEYLVFHFGAPNEVLRYDFGPKDSLDFPKRCADLCLSHYKPQQGIPNRALDIGCAVGRTSFELARVINEVIGIDFSQKFVDACNALKESGEMKYWVLDEGALVTDLIARIDSDIDRSRTSFRQGDACNLPVSLGQFGCVFAGNLICRLPNPYDFLNRLPTLVARGGILVITSPYTWLEEYTPKNLWLGGYIDKNGRKVTGFDNLKKVLGPDFDLLEDKDMPFFIRETAHKNQWTVAHATVWRRK